MAARARCGKSRRSNGRLQGRRAGGFIETRDTALRKSLERLPEVCEVSVDLKRRGAAVSKPPPTPPPEGTPGSCTSARLQVGGGVGRWDRRRLAGRLDPYLEGIGAGRFRAYSKFAYVFPGKPAFVAAAVARLREDQGEEARLASDADVSDVSVTGGLVEVSDPAFNQPSGYSFEGREDGVTEQRKDSSFPRLPRSLIERPEFKEILARFASYARLDPRYAAAADDDARRARDSDQSGRGGGPPRRRRSTRACTRTASSTSACCRRRNTTCSMTGVRTCTWARPRGEKPNDDEAAKKRPDFLDRRRTARCSSWTTAGCGTMRTTCGRRTKQSAGVEGLHGHHARRRGQRARVVHECFASSRSSFSRRFLVVSRLTSYEYVGIRNLGGRRDASRKQKEAKTKEAKGLVLGVFSWPERIAERIANVLLLISALSASDSRLAHAHASIMPLSPRSLTQDVPPTEEMQGAAPMYGNADSKLRAEGKSRRRPRARWSPPRRR